MRTIKSINSLRSSIKKFKRANRTIGFVPTMGALHAGHRSLIKKARRENDICMVSIFVNPIQFDPIKEDFSSYPRDKKNDILLAKEENVDIIFLPTNNLLYPKRFCSYVTTEGLTDSLCGKSRPGHFRGVTTVVTKLLNLVTPDILYLGQKDAQQAFVLRQMVLDLNFDTRLRICPTVREKDGLAFSSRNQRLSEQDRREAPILYKTLKEAKKMVQQGELKSSTIVRHIKSRITRQTRAEIDYVDCVQLENFKSVTHLKGKMLIALAVKFSNARLIDNIRINVK